MIQTMNIQPGVTLRCFPTPRFKQSSLSIQFIRPMCREEAALNALLPAVLLRGCREAPDLRKITMRLDELYGASISTLVRRVGDYQATGLCSSFICDHFALEGDEILRPMVLFLQELLLSPVLENGAFREDFVESEKTNLIATLEAQRNDKRAYCTAQMLKTMCREDSYGIPRLGEVEAVKAITPQALFHHYRKVLNQAQVNIFYVGSGDTDMLCALFQNLFRDMERNYVNLPAQTPLFPVTGGEHTETLEIAQGKLSMGFTTPINLRQGDFAAMQVCNVAFGGGMTSKLFMHVREKMSLCYDIGSTYYGSKGILTVNAGIDFDRKETVCQQVLCQLEALQKGQLSPRELDGAKQALLSSLQGIHDAPDSIESYYANAALSGLTLSPAEYIRAIDQVDKDRVTEAARQLQLDTVYFLKGVQ